MDHMISLLNRAGRTRPLAAIQRDTVMYALHHHNHNVTAAARALGVTKVTIYVWLRSYGVDIAKLREGK